MSAWTPRRFWTEARAEPCPQGFTVLLDARPVRTPAKAALVLPSLAMAQAIAAEWQAQDGTVKPATMPMTRMANSAIDKVAPQFDEVAALIAAYAETDLLCHRAAAPAALAARQAAAWDPLLDWAADHLDARLRVTVGIMPVAQPVASLDALGQAVRATTPFRLAALHDLVAITGSLVLGLALARGRIDAATAFALSRIDESWQAELWGQDAEAAESEAIRRAALADAERFSHLCG
jgi:chaperone required for assembly of F1-ATPase